RLVVKGLLQRCPIRRLLDFEARKFIVAFGVASFDGDGEFVARLHGFAGLNGCERKNAFRLKTDIEVYSVSRDRNHCGFASLAARLQLAGMALLELRENVFE